MPRKPICWLVLWWRKVLCLFVGYQTKRRDSLCSKDLNSLMTFRVGFLKATFAVRAAESMTFFWLVGVEITVWYLGSQYHQISSCNWSGFYVLGVGSYLLSIWWENFNICRTTKDIAQDIIYNPWGETKCLHFVLWPNYCYFVLLDFFICFCIFLINLFQFALWNSGKA